MPVAVSGATHDAAVLLLADVGQGFEEGSPDQGDRALRQGGKSRTEMALGPLRISEAMLAEALRAAGVRIGFGTDAGISVGWTAHTELADMVAAGMTAADVIVVCAPVKDSVAGSACLPAPRGAWSSTCAPPIDEPMAWTQVPGRCAWMCAAQRRTSSASRTP
mgnify:CR=1 FL=1